MEVQALRLDEDLQCTSMYISFPKSMPCLHVFCTSPRACVEVYGCPMRPANSRYIHPQGISMCWLRCNGSFRIQRPNRIKSDHIRSLWFSRSSRFSQIQNTTYIHLSNFQSARVRGGRTRKASALRNENPRRESDRATRVDLTYPMDDTQWCNFELAPVPF